MAAHSASWCFRTAHWREPQQAVLPSSLLPLPGPELAARAQGTPGNAFCNPAPARLARAMLRLKRRAQVQHRGNTASVKHGLGSPEASAQHIEKFIFLIKTLRVLTTAFLSKCFHMLGLSDTTAIQGPADSELCWLLPYAWDQLCLWGRCNTALKTIY